MVVCFRGMQSKSWNVLSRVVLKIRTSKLCVVPFLMTFHTRIFGVYQEIDSYSIFFREGYILNLRAEITTRSLFFYHVAKEARKTRGRRIRTEQNSPMGFRPLDESAPSARLEVNRRSGYDSGSSQLETIHFRMNLMQNCISCS